MSLPTIIIGAGQAGLATAEHLSRRGLEFVVLERGAVGESWRSQRWDSFVLNTPGWANGLPGVPCDGERDGFIGRADFVRYLERYAWRFGQRVRCDTPVSAVRREAASGLFHVETANERLVAYNVVVAAGLQQTARLPAWASDASARLRSLHAADYRSPGALPPGAVLVIGSAQSGCQIAEDLLAAGRRVLVATSQVARVPRRHRGRDVFEWLVEMGVQDERLEALADPAQRYATQAQISGVGRYGRSVSLGSLERQGATLLGRALGFRGEVLLTADDLGQNARFADESSAKVKTAIDAYIARAAFAADSAEVDPADAETPELYERRAPTELDLAREGVSTVVFCTGFRADLGWLEGAPVDERGLPAHSSGVSPWPGLYFVGFPWLSRRKSGLIWGVSDDAESVTGRIAERTGA